VEGWDGSGAAGLGCAAAAERPAVTAKRPTINSDLRKLITMSPNDGGHTVGKTGARGCRGALYTRRLGRSSQPLGFLPMLVDTFGQVHILAPVFLQETLRGTVDE
jgi:hypothetical protein